MSHVDLLPYLPPGASSAALFDVTVAIGRACSHAGIGPELEIGDVRITTFDEQDVLLVALD